MANKTNYMTATFLNKEVQIYPADSHSKFGIVREINDSGVVFEITRSDSSVYHKGEIVFIAFSARLAFTLARG